MTSADFPFFVVGSARSGTTMLRLMLNAHPEVAVPPESRFIVELYKGSDEVEVEPLLRELARHKRFRHWELPVEAVRSELGNVERTYYSDVMRATYKAYARLQGKTRWGDKTPRYVEDIGLLSRILDDARFIHLIRDGRNVSLSYADVPFGPKTVAQVADLWSRRVASGMDEGRRLEHRYIEVRYEDLVDDAAGEIKNLCEFLDLEFDPGILDYTERARDAVLPRASTFNPNVTRRPMANMRSWEDAMPESQIEIFEAIAGPVLSELGYPRRYPSPGRLARIKAAIGRVGLPVGYLRKSTHRPVEKRQE
jgi:hypothetical protein